MTNDPQVLRRYLLGTASETERDRLEDGYFSSDAALAAMEDTEDALVESYLDRTLSADEHAAFERHYLASPSRRRRVEVARALHRAAARTHSSVHWPGLALAAAAVLAITVAGLVWISRSRTPPQTGASATTAEAPILTPGTTPGDVPRPPVVVSLVVPSIAVRGGGAPPTARVPSDTDVLSLRLLIDQGRPSPAAPFIVVETVEGREVWQGAGTVTDGIEVPIPASRLGPGDYVAILFDASGLQPVEHARYFLRLQRAP